MFSMSMSLIFILLSSNSFLSNILLRYIMVLQDIPYLGGIVAVSRNRNSVGVLEGAPKKFFFSRCAISSSYSIWFLYGVLHFKHICILYIPGPVLAVLVHRMGIWSDPLKNGLIQHTSKMYLTDPV